MTEPHWNETDPAEDPDYDRIEAAEPGAQDAFPGYWGAEATERDQAALDSGAAEEALYQDLIDSGWTPPPAPVSIGAHALVGDDADPATASIDTTPVPIEALESEAADIVGLPAWD